MCQCIIFFLDCKVVVSIFCLSPGVDAATIILAVEVVFVGEFDGTFVSILFLKVGWEVLDMVDLRQFFSDFVDLGRIFQWADREGCCEIVIAAFFCQFCSFFHTQTVAFETAFTAFGYIFEAFCHLEEFLWIVVALHQFDRMFKFHGIYQSGNFVDSFLVFFFRVDVWVVVEYCDVEIF